MDIFDVYFASIVGMQFHPGYRRDGNFLTTEQCAQLAIEMMQTKHQHLQEIEKWLSLLEP